MVDSRRQKTAGRPWSLLRAAALCCFLHSAAPAPADDARHILASAESCRECHREHVDQWKNSPLAHFSRARNLPLERLWKAREEVAGKKLDGCPKCHEPLAKFVAADQGAWARTERVTCTFCHAIGADHGGDAFAPGSGAKTASVAVSRKEAGLPVGEKGSDLCLRCHQNRRPEYTEFQARFPTEKITCAGCHMPLREGKDPMHSHSFPGGFSEAMLRKAVRFDMQAARSDSGIEVRISAANNVKAHYIPTGSELAYIVRRSKPATRTARSSGRTGRATRCGNVRRRSSRGFTPMKTVTRRSRRGRRTRNFSSINASRPATPAF
jgi:ssDNA-binding Zn-finger/Zn-ribbon topoisomerase 1